MLLHGFLCRPGGMPGQGLEDLAMLLPGFLRTLRADERQLLTFQENLGAGGDQGEHRLVAAGGENTLVKLEIQPVGLLEIACTQLAALLLDVVFENIQHLGGHHPDRQTTGKTLQGEAQLKGIGRRHLRTLVNLFEGKAWHAPMEIRMLERHPLGSQAFYPVDGGRMLIVVAPPGELDESKIRAFISTPDQGVNYARGTWHHPLLCLQHPGRFLVVDRGGDGHNCDEQPLKQPLSVLNLR